MMGQQEQGGEGIIMIFYKYNFILMKLFSFHLMDDSLYFDIISHIVNCDFERLKVMLQTKQTVTFFRNNPVFLFDICDHPYFSDSTPETKEKIQSHEIRTLIQLLRFLNFMEGSPIVKLLVKKKIIT